MDRRSSKPAVLQELRERAVAMKMQGHTHAQIAEALKIGQSTSRLYWSLYRQGGEEGIRLGQRGRPAGIMRRLNRRQESAIQRAIVDKTPDQLKMPFALWTRQAIGELIQRRYQIKLPVRTLGEYLKRWGFTPQKPKRKEYAQQPEAVQKWLDEEYPAIEAKARREKAEIYWGDETGMNNQDQTGRGYAPRGKTPVRKAMAKKVSTSMISAVTNKGQLRFMVYHGGMNNDLFIKFLGRLIKSSSKKVFLIVDNLRVHKSKKVQQWLGDHQEEIRVYYLPPYCPELNPDEYLNNTLKKQLENYPPASTIAEQQERIRRQMRSNQKRPELVISLFSAANVRYAA